MLITDRVKQMVRCSEHYTKLYATENGVSEEAASGNPSLLVIKELSNEPTLAEQVRQSTALPAEG